jgi:hypothetical protein
MRLIKGLKNAGRNKIATPTAPEAIKAAPQKPAPLKAGPVTGGSKPVTIEAKIDVGYGNSLYLRGEGSGLDWNRGIPLANVDGTTWKWSCEASEALKFKLLLNDAVWSQGEDLLAKPGQKLQVSPKF